MIRYRSDIDGLRAVAILPVVLYHAKIGPFVGGFTGVDVFFVISGFLITSMLMGDLSVGQYSIVDFYERRIRRIIPALIFVLVPVLICGLLTMLPHDLRTLGASAAATTLFSSNIFFWRTSGYFESASELSPLLHTWSLAVEEQFYVLYPLLLYLIWRFARARVFAVIAMFAIVSFLYNIYAVRAAPTFDFYMLPSRAWELMIGSLLCFDRQQVAHQRFRDIASLCGLALILLGIFNISESMPFPGFAALLPCLGAALVIFGGNFGPSWAGRLLGTKPLVWVGLISYSLYLWHWPALVFARYISVGAPSWPVNVAVLAGAFALSFFSWRFVERPFRRSRHVGRGLLFGLAAISMCATATTGAMLYLRRGLPARLPANIVALAQGADDQTPYRNHCLYWPSTEIAKGRLCDVRLGDKSSGTAPTFILWGDSHGDALSPAVSAAASRAHLAGINATLASCPPLLGVDLPFAPDCARFNALVLATIQKQHIRNVILVARWALYAEGSRYGIFESGMTVLFAQTVAEQHAAFAAGLRRTLDALARTGVKTTVVGPIPESRYDVPSTLARAAIFHVDVHPEPAVADFRARQAFVLPLLEELRKAYGFALVQPAEVLCGPESCAIVRDAKPLYYDNHHLSMTGAALIEPLFAPVLANSRGGHAH